jgi:indole-3-glycerol phosphate synthase
MVGDPAAIRGRFDGAGTGMSGFLDDMARSSAARVAQALQHESAAALERRARAAPPSPPLRLSASGFDVIAELKLRSPAAGRLGSAGQDWPARVAAYARAGAAAVSVLTEPSRFDGSLEHLQKAAAVLSPLGVPAMRKDFLVDPYQVLEARAAGAGGVLVILRMLPRVRIMELLDACAEHAMFVLLEAFDSIDLDAAREILASRRGRGSDREELILIGINCRDLKTLEVVPERFAALAPMLPAGLPAVAESGVNSAGDARRMQLLGYGAALIGTALMAREDPSQLLREIFDATRTVQS